MTDNINYRELAAALLEQGGVRLKAAGSTPTASYGHGPGGLFSSPGLSQALFSAMILPKLGLQSRLPSVGSVDMNPLYGIITGVTASSGSEPTNVCDDPPSAGLAKLCTHSFVFGRLSRRSKVYDIDRAGKMTNRGEFADFIVSGNPFGGNDPNVLAPTVPGALDPNSMARYEVSKALFEMATAWSRDFARLTYTGDPANNTAGGGYKEFYGLDTLINTGYRDAETGVACAAADSIVRDFADADIATNAANFIRQITTIYRQLKYIAARAYLDPVKWVISMPFSMFYEITEFWPVNYATYRGTANLPNGVNFNIDSMAVERMRDDMRGDLYNYTGQYLLIDGQRVEVVLDDAITETENGDGTFTADVYFVPLTVLGTRQVTYWEHFNYDTPNGPIAMASQFAPADSYYTSDGGRFLWHKKPPTNFCVEVLAKTEPRLLLLTPYLAARLTNCRYSPIDHERSPFTDSNYFVNGGRTDGSGIGPSYFPPTA